MMKILVAEDDFASNLFLAQYLAQYGVVDRVVDGLETLEAYTLAIQEGNPYDIIFLDIMMPKVDGVKVLKAIRDYEGKKGIKLDQRVKIILTTALDQTNYIRKAFAIGCEGCLAKPIDTHQITEIISTLGTGGDRTLAPKLESSEN